MEKVRGSSPLIPTIFMYTVYVLKNSVDGSRYVGFTNKPVSQRVREHLNGSNKSTKFKAPFELIHYEEFQDQSIALAGEKFFKTGDGKRVLNNLVGKSARHKNDGGRSPMF